VSGLLQGRLLHGVGLGTAACIHVFGHDFPTIGPACTKELLVVACIVQAFFSQC
jgi:hypothetical protein